MRLIVHVHISFRYFPVVRTTGEKTKKYKFRPNFSFKKKADMI